jgi:beta-lactamase superfamily II metal-dependent hydrolase
MVLGGCENNTTQEATTEKETVWTITQFNALYDEVQSFYTIMDESGGIIVIDGGNTDNEEIVRRVLEGYGGQVKIWILTRPDTQHIGAFMKIYEDPQNISIAQVYDAFIDWQRYDDYGNRAARNMYEEYLKLTKDDAKIVHVNRDAKFYGCGLEFECFNAYDSYVEEYTQDLSQDGSLMLKISGKKQTFLFCSDVSYDMEQFLIDEYADKLNADYVQMSNHGNDGLSLEFYKLVSPSVAFFDGKSSIYDQSNVPEGRSYDDYKAYFEENGVTMYDLSTAPNIVEFR